MAIHSLVGFDELNLDEALADHRLDFDTWTVLISNVENKYSDDINKLSLAYDSFLSKFPLCCGYWRKYAAHKARLSSVEEAVEVYEKAVESASFSVDVWVDYCSFAVLIFEDPFDVSRLFRRGLSYVGKDYLCHALWDIYMEFEFSQKQWSSLSQIYIEALKHPTKKLHQYYHSFKKIITIWEEEMGCHRDSIVKLQPENGSVDEFTVPEDDEVSSVIIDLLEPSTRSEALKKYLSIGEHLYKRASRLDLKIDCFERNIHRTYFHVKPLDDDQLENWKQYLDLVEMNGDFDWAVKLYERCLIPCASYSEFWMRYVEYVESKGGREIANDALERATRIFLKDLPIIHLFSAGFKEQIGDICGARTAFLHFDMHSESSFVDHAMRRANMEKRLGDNVAASNVYKEAIVVATKEMPDTLPILYVQFSHLQYMITNSVDAARDILIDGIPTVANCKLLLEELINLAVNHEGARQVSILDPIVADAIMLGSDVSRGLSYKDRLDISELYLKFIDLTGNIHDSRKAWNRHIKLFPRSLRAYSTNMQHVRETSPRNIFTDTTHVTAFANPKQVTRSDDMSTSIQLTTDNAENLKGVPDEDGNGKVVEKSYNLVGEAADIDLDVQKEQLHVSGRDEPPSLVVLSLNEPHNEPPSLSSSVHHASESYQEASQPNSMLECEQNTGPQPASGLFSVEVNKSESPTNITTPSIRSPRCSKDQKDPERLPFPSDHGSPKGQTSRKYSEDQKSKESSVSVLRRGSPNRSEGKHHEDGSLHSLRHHSRWSSVERQGNEQPRSPRQPFSPDEMGAQSYLDRHRQNRPMYYEHSRGQRGRRMQRDRRGPGNYGRRAQNVHNQRFTSTSQMQPPAQPVGGYPSGHMDQYPMQSSDQQANMQSNQNQAYNQMWQYYFYYQQQQQQLMLMQQQQQQLMLMQQQPQEQPQQQQQQQQEQLQLQVELQQPQSQVHVQSQANQVQVLQNQYEQMQKLMQLQYQQQAEHGHQTPQAEQQEHQMQLQQQMQAYQYEYQQQYLLYLQQQQGGSLEAQQVVSAENQDQNEVQLQQEQQLPQTRPVQQVGDYENEGASSQIKS